MDQLLTTMYVVPIGNTLPVSGTSANLTPSQFGIFMPDNSPATVGTVGNAKYIYFAQARNINAPEEGTKKSDWIYKQAGTVLDWYKVTGNLEQNTQVTQVSNLNAGCNQDISITLRLDSFYIRAAYNNGLTRSVMVTTPCCNCGSNPCDTLQPADVQATMEALAQAINSDEILSQFVTAGVDGTGSSTVILIQGNTLQVYGQGTSADLTNFPYQFDRMSFWTYVMNGPVLTTDYEVLDACDVVADTAILQRASYPINTTAEVQQLEKDYWSYQAIYKSIFSNVNYNGEFQTYVDSVLAYNLYYLHFNAPAQGGTSVGQVQQDEWVILAFPKGDSSETNAMAILTAFFGTPDNDLATPSTTSTYTTSSTSTTTTTEVTP